MKKTVFLLLVLSLFIGPSSSAQDSSKYVNKAWAASGTQDFESVHHLTDQCIELFSREADRLAKNLDNFPSQAEIDKYKVMNDVAVCYFIKLEALGKYYQSLEERLKSSADDKEKDSLNSEKDKVKKQAFSLFDKVRDRYPYARGWDPRGWYYSVIKKVKKIMRNRFKVVPESGDGEQRAGAYGPVTMVVLHDKGDSFPVNYGDYGTFHGLDSEAYKYVIDDPEGLSEAVGEGIFPNTNSLKFDPEFIKVRKSLGRINHWEILNTRDLSAAFYKWCVAPEPPGVRQFYIGDILERGGQIEHAIKAYYAVVTHFPRTVGWTYWNTPWYVGKAAIYRIQFLLRKYPELGWSLEGAYIKVGNGTDNDIRNDKFIVNPGRFTKGGYGKACRQEVSRELGKAVDERGGKDIKLVKYSSGDWQFLVNDKPFILHGITYDPTRVGESPDEGTLEDWTNQDVNKNGLIDSPYETWVDKNRNNVRDGREKTRGDFRLLKDMGVNCIRVYRKPGSKLNKELFRDMYRDYGIYLAMGDFLGKYAIGSGASWEEGTDYDNPRHCQNMLDNLKDMVEEFKEEPYILMWLLGNENVYGVACNADKKPESFFKFVNRAARLIKSLDPYNRPVAIVSGDSLYLGVFGKECPDVDIFGTNCYRGKYGFLDLWDEVKTLADKPVIITEYGCPSYAESYTLEEAESFQAEYHSNCWKDIFSNRCGYGQGNALGGIVFQWVDEWWKAYDPWYHDEEGLFTGPFLDGYMHEEWLGLSGQGNGTGSPFLRQLKKSYFSYKKLWQRQ